VPPTAEHFSKTDIIGVIQQIFAEQLDAEVKNVNLTLSMNASTGLADLLKDEMLPKPMPMNVSTVIFMNHAYFMNKICILSKIFLKKVIIRLSNLV
jgi:hypothetical protein